MSMTIKIGYTTDNPLKVGKSVTWINSSVYISPLSTISQLAPVFVIDYNSLYLNANYVECTDLSRSYFCTVSVDTAGRMVLSCNVDVLQRSDLGNCKITVTRNGGIGKPTKIPDSKYPVIPNIENTMPTIAFSDYFIQDEYPLITDRPKYVVMTVRAGEIS